MTASSQDSATCGSTTTSSIATPGGQSVFLISSSSSPKIATTNHRRHETSARDESQSKRVEEKVARIGESIAAVVVEAESISSSSSSRLRAQIPSNSSDSAISSTSSSSSSSSSTSSAPSNSSVDDEDNVSSIDSEVFHCNDSQHQSETDNGEERAGDEQVASSPTSSSSTSPRTSQALLLLQTSLSSEEADDGHLVDDSAQDLQQTSLIVSSENNDDADNNNGDDNCSPTKTLAECGRLSQSSSSSAQKASRNNNSRQQQPVVAAPCSIGSLPTPANINQSASLVYAQTATLVSPVVASGQHQFQEQQNAYYKLVHHQQQPAGYVPTQQAVAHFPSAIYTATSQRQHQSGALLAASQYQQHQQAALTLCELVHQHQQPVYYYHPYHHHQQQQLIGNSHFCQARSSSGATEQQHQRQQARVCVDALGQRQIDCEQKITAPPSKISEAPISVAALSTLSGSRSSTGTNTCQIKAAALGDESGVALPETNPLARPLSNSVQADDKDHHRKSESRFVADVNGSIENNESGRNNSSNRASSTLAGDASTCIDKRAEKSSSLESAHLLAACDNSKGEQQDGNKTNFGSDVHSDAQNQHGNNVKQELPERLARQSELNSPCSRASSSSSSAASSLQSRPDSCSSSASSGPFMSRQQNVGSDLQPSAASTSNFGYYHDHHHLYQQQQPDYATYLAPSAQASAANAARYSARCGPAHPAYYMEHLAPPQAAFYHHQYSQQQQQQQAARCAPLAGRHYLPAPIHAAAIYSMHPPPALPVLLVGPASGGQVDKPMEATYYHQQSPYSPAYYYLGQPAAAATAVATLRSHSFPYFGPAPTSGDLSPMAIQQMPAPIYDASMQHYHHHHHHQQQQLFALAAQNNLYHQQQQLVGSGNLMAPQVAHQPVIAFSQQQFKLQHHHQYQQQQQYQRQQHFNLIPLLPIDAQPASTRQAYGMDKVWQDEFERLFSRLISGISWSLEEVESVPNIRNSPNIIDYRGRYIVNAPDQPEEQDTVDSASENASECDEDQVDSAAEEFCNTSADSVEDIGERTMIGSQKDDQDGNGEADSSETGKRGMNEERATKDEAGLLSHEDQITQLANSNSTTDEQISSSGETESDCDSGALVNSIGGSGSETCPRGPLGDSTALQQENNQENDESNRQQQGFSSASGRKLPTRFKMFIDSAKVRFSCEHCGHGWTSMKGRVVFWYELFELIGADESPSSTNYAYTNFGESYETAGGGGNTMIGYCAYKLFGQQCDVCKIEDRFERPMWYPEEVTKVLNNLYNKVGQIYFGFKMPAIDKQRRAGKPKTSHNSSLCQACYDGVCTDRK